LFHDLERLGKLCSKKVQFIYAGKSHPRDNTGKGYLKIINFGSDTTTDVMKALKYFREEKISKIIIDLRYNPGGLLTAAISISDFFLEKGLTIVSTKGRSEKNNRAFTSENDPSFKGEIIILVNRGSASASEILSAAIRDNKKGRLLGEKTFGKGSVQKSYNLNDNIGIAITIAKYYTPSGECIHNKGIEPDYRVSFREFTDEDKANLQKLNKQKLMDSFVKKGTLYDEKSKKEFHDYLQKNSVKLTEYTEHYILKQTIYKYRKRPVYDLEFDTQLNRAIELLDGKS